jgi:acetyltransferase-like isoleucine patch superfamily enzyme
MFQALKFFYWDIKDPTTRRFHIYELVRNTPGRLGVHLRFKALKSGFKKHGTNLRINRGTTIIGIHNLSVGNRVHFGVDSYLQATGGLEIGDHTLMGPGVKIWTQNHTFTDPDAFILDSGYDYAPVTIGKDVWVGANSFIMPGATIGDGCVISAFSCVGAKNWPEYSIIAGNPARKIGVRGNHKQ